MKADKNPKKKNRDRHGNGIYISTKRRRRGKQHSTNHNVVDKSERRAKKDKAFAYFERSRIKAIKKAVVPVVVSVVVPVVVPVVDLDSFLFDKTLFD